MPQANHDDGTVRISEIFHSIQGEGPSAGTPATFVRLQGCAVGCRWCDTKYSWDFRIGDAMSAEQILDEAERKGEAPLLVVTGGEPLAQPGVVHVLREGLARFARVEVETSGIEPPPLSDERLSYSVSPKLPSVTPTWDTTWAHAAAWVAEPNTTFKIVVDSEAEVEEVSRLIEQHGIPKERVMLMPEGMTEHQLRSRTLALTDAFKRHAFRMSPRLHIWLWGAKRGV